ncbi:MAG TPA: extracellular solute-binding protein [Actinospica sp.]|jgi:multiple sugar transport system substrate-binding protein|nr:extracellular solute-binding protein [Actinospica sp.]
MHGRRKLVAAAGTLLLGAASLSGCTISSGSSSASSKTITVAYQEYGDFTQLNTEMQSLKTQYEKANPGYTVKLEPIQASENDYYTKLTLMNRSASTAPDVMYEDTFLIDSDIQAGYLAPLDSYLSKWSDWSEFTSTAKSAAVGSDGKTYGVPMGTDTRALYYNKTLFKQAGLPVPWQPKTWADVLSAAQTIKSKLPGVTPINVYSGKGSGEGSTMQGLEMLLYGTANQLYDSSSKKWVPSSPGMLAALNFIKTVYTTGLGPDVQDALNPNFGTTVQTELIPEGKLAIDLDGSWVPGNWTSTGSKPWAAWSSTIGEAAMPTQNGQAPGSTSMSGGWVLSVGSHSANKQAAFNFVALAENKENALNYDVIASQIAERTDVASDPKYLSTNPTTGFFTNLVKVTHFRPAYPVYPQISDQIQVAMESVMTGQSSPSAAMSTLATETSSIAGASNVATG